jgi:hypothetical protein
VLGFPPEGKKEVVGEKVVLSKKQGWTRSGAKVRGWRKREQLRKHCVR